MRLYIDVDKSYLEGGIDKNQLYGLTFGINAYCIAANPLVFEKAGVEIPKSGYTYDELYEVAKKLKAQIKDEGFYPLANFVDFNTYVRSRGSIYFNSTGTALGYEDDKIYTDYFNIEKKWMDEGLIAPDSLSDKNALITSGKSAIWWGVSNNVAGLSKTAKTIDVVEEGQKEVKDGIATVYAAGTSFDMIQNSINEVRNTIEEVSKASKHMSEGTDKLVKSFDTIEEISKTAADGTQNVSASTEEQLATMEGVTNSASSLSSMSEDLLNLISTFKIDNNK